MLQVWPELQSVAFPRLDSFQVGSHISAVHVGSSDGDWGCQDCHFHGSSFDEAAAHSLANRHPVSSLRPPAPQSARPAPRHSHPGQAIASLALQASNALHSQVQTALNRSSPAPEALNRSGSEPAVSADADGPLEPSDVSFFRPLDESSEPLVEAAELFQLPVQTPSSSEPETASRKRAASEAPRRRKKGRTTLEPWQLEILRAAYRSEFKFIRAEMAERLGQSVGMRPERVAAWFTKVS